MEYQVLVKDLFNDMFAFFSGRQTMDLRTLADTYADEPLFLAFMGNLDQALCVPYKDVMKQCYAFYKQYCGRELSEEDWQNIIEGIQFFNHKWQNTWCRGVMLAVMSILEKEDNIRKGVQPADIKPEDNLTEEVEQEVDTAA